MSTLRRFVSLALVAVALTPALAAHGDESLETVEYWKTQGDYLQKVVDSTNTACGTHMTYAWINKPEFRKKASDHNNSPYSICGDVFDSLRGVCDRGDEAKKRVQAKVKSVSCGYANPHTIAIAGGKLTLMSNQEQANFDDWAKVQLGNAL